MVGSKKFPESRLLAEISAQLVENKSDLQVERRLGLGGTLICFEAIKQGEIDIYPEYTGTGLTAILKMDNPPRDAAASFRMVHDEFKKSYGLLPIIRNTHAGIKGINDELMESGISMGLSRRQLLHMLQLPLAAPVIMAGIKTSMVINVGTATLAAFIGAGGLGDFIITGITLNDHNLIIKGAMPAALLALLINY